MVFYFNKSLLLYFPLVPGCRTFVLSNEGQQATDGETGGLTNRFGDFS